MVIVVTLKNPEWKHRYEGVKSFEVKPKEEIRKEIDETTYNEMDKYIFRMYFEDGEQATFGVNPDFDYKVLFYNWPKGERLW